MEKRGHFQTGSSRLNGLGAIEESIWKCINQKGPPFVKVHVKKRRKVELMAWQFSQEREFTGGDYARRVGEKFAIKRRQHAEKNESDF
ncbi:hypothetical protein VIGAN_UM010200 [Vigna angularis var. angularis]|uniref:Uncharacterized protein n=1 Tax=Vigna angularis var. angularis TaxID=157739 RepID=A0A0S3TDA2_PHAAN|nr:hypothetical protein VIGAN_UM010200 [Vigna angularis var. angularis]